MLEHLIDLPELVRQPGRAQNGFEDGAAVRTIQEEDACCCHVHGVGQTGQRLIPLSGYGATTGRKGSDAPGTPIDGSGQPDVPAGP